ncbi:MAG: hypothetical protein ACKVS9_02755 [Phycisphaerae bacterium]
MLGPASTLGEFTSWFDPLGTDSATLTGTAMPLFADAFRHPTLDDRRWEFSAGVTWFASDSVGGVQLRAGDDRPFAELRTRALDLSDLTGARVRIRATPIGTGSSPLEVECISDTGSWLKALLVAGSPTTDSIEYEISADGLHAAAQVRIRSSATAASAWFLREVAIFGRSMAAERVLSIDAVGPQPVPLTLRIGGDAQLVDAATPLRLPIAGGIEIQATAPAVFEGFVLSHWLIDDATRIDRQRTVALSSNVQQRAVAAYRAPREDDLAYLAIRSEPESDIPIALASAGSTSGERMLTNRIAPCLRGERLTLCAPKRTPRLVFDHWRLSGGRMVASPALELSADATQSLTAVYVVLGDMNTDGTLDAYDVDLFCEAMKHASEQPMTRAGLGRCDMNGDSLFDEADIEAFVERLVTP